MHRVFPNSDGSTNKIVTKDGENQSDKSELVHSDSTNPTAEKVDFIPLVKSTSRIKTDSSNTNTYFYRPDLNALNHSRESVVPQEMAFGYLSNFNTWDIAGQETVAGRNCFKIEGTLTGGYAQKLNAYSYTLWVDSETGILLKYKNYGKNGQETDSLETLQISVNSNLQPAELSDAAAKSIPAKYLQQLYSVKQAGRDYPPCFFVSKNTVPVRQGQSSSHTLLQKAADNIFHLWHREKTTVLLAGSDCLTAGGKVNVFIKRLYFSDMLCYNKTRMENRTCPREPSGIRKKASARQQGDFLR